MIKANELRIGNLISNDGCVCEVLKIFGGTYDYCTLKTKQGSEINTHYKLLKPIELTEEWLIKLGFRKDRNGYRLDDINSISFSENFVVCWHDKVLGIKQIKYVHQLQNLYFCLTGEELKIN